MLNTIYEEDYADKYAKIMEHEELLHIRAFRTLPNFQTPNSTIPCCDPALHEY
jgi:hypothetical protein